MTEGPSEELIKRTYDALTALAEYPTMQEKNLARPPAKIIQEIFTSLSKATGFPDPSIVKETEIPKDQKEERIQYIQLIITTTAEFLHQEIVCEAKNITAGKVVDQTLMFLLKLCEACRIHKASEQEALPAEPVTEEPVQEEPIAQPIEEEPAAPVEDIFNPEPVKEDIFNPEPAVQPAPAVEPIKRATRAEEEPELDVIGAPPEDVFPSAPAAAREARSAARAQEDELRQYEEARRVQEQNELALQRLTNKMAQEALSQLPTAGEKVQPAAPRKQTRETAAAASGYQVRIMLDEDSDEKKAGEGDAEIDIAETLGFSGDQKLAGLFEAAAGPSENGVFLSDAQRTAESYQMPRSAEEKTRAAAQKVTNQANAKLIGAVQDAVRQVIPFSKATSFLEEHLVRMRQELLAAVDDCQAQEQARQRHANLENKSKSVLDARLRSVQEQLATVKQSIAELAQQVFI